MRNSAIMLESPFISRRKLRTNLPLWSRIRPPVLALPSVRSASPSLLSLNPSTRSIRQECCFSL
ncbi:hypothetical protein RHMOL_Rhmol09G0212100 [Rhododendron molle]|uniref:Uncharacterized protein n=1 Tax=Rhododendron molle TaxID=49168 RepID=A0ACC0MHJ6_RHOML|nr:hypothetical protein RHMOL_Rhmol09G0212100 [Rhododendron molle]